LLLVISYGNYRQFFRISKANGIWTACIVNCDIGYWFHLLNVDISARVLSIQSQCLLEIVNVVSFSLTHI